MILCLPLQAVQRAVLVRQVQSAPAPGRLFRTSFGATENLLPRFHVELVTKNRSISTWYTQPKQKRPTFIPFPLLVRIPGS